MVWSTVRAANHTARTVLGPFACGVGDAAGFCFHNEFHVGTRPAPELAIPARVGTEFVGLEVQRKARFGDFDAAEF